MRAAILRFALLLLFVASPAWAQSPAEMVRAWESSNGEECILSFVSDVKVERDGGLDVTETIRLVSLADQIRHGIQRDFPTSYSSGLGQRTNVGFSILSVSRDGQDEPWELMSLSNGVRIRIGSAEATLPPGEHVYVFRYRTTRQLRYGDTSDELYWNVTGTGWTFPIDSAEARITLPSAAPFGDRAVYTGPQGSTARDARVIEERPGFIAFRTTAPLPRENGLTVAAAFPKGVVEAPNARRRLGWWLEDWAALGAALLSVVGLLVFYFRAWLKIGRGPKAGPVVPIFTPPDDLTPAASRYIRKMKLDDRAFTAAIVDLGVRGALRIHKEDGGWFGSDTTRLERTGAAVAVPAPEATMLAKLFSSGETIELKQENHSVLRSARSSLEAGLEEAHCGTMFKRHREWALYGLVAIAGAILLTALVAVLVRSAPAHPAEWLSALVGSAAIIAAWRLYVLTGKASGWRVAMAWLGLVLAVGIGALCAMIAVGSALSDGKWPVLLPLVTLPVGLTAFSWIYAPTVAGRAVMDRIAGFRHYLGITEEERLEALHPPEKTPELFQRYLPYAIALDVENRWADKFARVLATAAAAGAAAHTASWYSGGGNLWDDPGGFADEVGSSLASTVSSAATAPSSSSSGSGGGGSSGGGGGGGGGSGW